jgi:hypothetical protein
MISRRGVYKNIEESNFCFIYNDTKFYFSSLTKLNKFKNKLDDYVEYMKKNIDKKIILKYDYKLIGALKLYELIEKDKFKICYNNKIYLNKNELCIKII